MRPASVDAVMRRRCNLRRSAVAALAVAAAALAGCATTPEQNNPADGGFFRAVQGVSGGQYEQRQRQRETELSEREEVGRRLSERYEQIQRDQEALDREIEDLTRRLGDLEAQIAWAGGQLDSLQTDNVELRRSLDAASARLARARREARDGSGIGEHNVQRIASEINEIEALVTQLTANF